MVTSYPPGESVKCQMSSFYLLCFRVSEQSAVLNSWGSPEHNVMLSKIDWTGRVSEAEYPYDPLHGDVVVTLSRGSGGHLKMTGQAPPRRR